jgi:hypothetical protein
MNERIKELLTRYGITNEVTFDSNITEEQLFLALSQPNVSRVYVNDSELHIEYHQE